LGKNLDIEELDNMTKDLDSDSDNRVDFEEFSSYWLSGRQ